LLSAEPKIAVVQHHGETRGSDPRLCIGHKQTGMHRGQQWRMTTLKS
jgi:hypothetical protein